ncbi:GMC family oxidoreductase [Actinoplanes sp. NPDC049265]|uniref:GMC family oxidoreductase n=1 Tax=Actinoplanes sp. NPDC049265 TaxID=3363902 RepID=UPI003720F262
MYDYIVCGSGSAGSAVAGRLAEDPGVSVLLIEAGGPDDVAAVQDPDLWPLNFGSDRLWDFTTVPDEAVGGRTLGYAMGRVLGGGGSVNVSNWVRGHRDDWDHYANVTGDPAWSYPAVSELFERIEEDPMRVGRAAPDPLGQAVLAAAEQAGFPRHPDPNGELSTRDRGTATSRKTIRDGRRRSPYRSYVAEPGRPNLTVRPHTLVLRVLIENGRAVGVRVRTEGRTEDLRAGAEVVLSLGAVNTPKVLMLSGLGDAAELGRHGLPVIRHLPGVGRNLQDHAHLDVVFDPAPDARLPPPGDTGVATFWPSGFMYVTPASSGGVSFMVGVPMREPGRVRLASADPAVTPLIETGYFTHPEDVPETLEALDTARSIATAPALRQWVAGERRPGPADFGRYLRETVETFWHQTGTARMGGDELAVVDSRLRVRGCDGLRVADASVLPRVPMANTMAPSVAVGELAASFIRDRA